MDEIQDIGKQFGELNLIKFVGNYASEVYIGDKYIFKHYTLQNKLEKKDYLKERYVLELLNRELELPFKQIVPKYVSSFETTNGHLEVHTKLTGTNPEGPLNNEQAQHLGEFLAALHKIGPYDEVSEFEEGKSSLGFPAYIISKADKYVTNLREHLSDQVDLALIEKAIDYVKDCNINSYNAKLVLIHKDLTLNNLLYLGNKLTGLVDWEASQIGPPEWEFAILRQRMPNIYQKVVGSYGNELNSELINLCGVVQSLRFWKGHPHDKDFVEMQKSYIKQILKH